MVAISHSAIQTASMTVRSNRSPKNCFAAVSGLLYALLETIWTQSSPASPSSPFPFLP